MLALNFSITLIGGLLMAVGMHRVGGLGCCWILLGLSPYIALAMTAVAVHVWFFSDAARRAALASSVVITGISAALQFPILLHPGGCMDGMVVLFSVPLLVGVPIVHGLAYLVLRPGK